MILKNSDIYKEIINGDKTIPIAFYSKTGITINENNINAIIDVEIKKAKDKISLIGDIYNFDNIFDKIKKQYIIGEPYLILEYAYLNKENIDKGITIIETSDNFYKWLL
jgi:hypothetical protein